MTQCTVGSFGSQPFTDQEFNSIQEALRKRLGPDFVASRPGPGGQKLQYVEGWRVVELANQTFGFDGWGYSVTNMTVDFVDHSSQKYYVGVSATVKVTLKNGAFREDVGYGCVDGMRSKSQSIEKARKESITDGLKRALKSFGNLLGNCLNDKEYMKHVSKCAKRKTEAYPEDSIISTSNVSTLPNYSKVGQSNSAGVSRIYKTNSMSSFGSALRSGVSTSDKTSTPLSNHPVNRTNTTNVTTPGNSMLLEGTDISINDTATSVTETIPPAAPADSPCESFSQLDESADSKFWEDVLSNIDENNILVSKKTPKKTITGRAPRVRTPLRESPRLTSKRRRVAIPGLTNGGLKE